MSRTRREEKEEKKEERASEVVSLDDVRDGLEAAEKSAEAEKTDADVAPPKRGRGRPKGSTSTARFDITKIREVCEISCAEAVRVGMDSAFYNRLKHVPHPRIEELRVSEEEAHRVGVASTEIAFLYIPPKYVPALALITMITSLALPRVRLTREIVADLEAGRIQPTPTKAE